MSRQLHSLPPLRDMVDMLQPRGIPAPPDAAWTAINHQPEGPVSPRTRHANPRANAQPSPPSHHHARTENPSLPPEQTTATSSSTQPIYGAVSFEGHPARFSSEHHIAGKPITARQDSAVFASATSQPPTILLPGNSSRSGRSPEIYHRPARDAVTHPLTPPSDPFSHQSYSRSVPTHPPMYGRPPAPPSTGSQQDAPDMSFQRRRERFDSDVNSRDVPPLPHTTLFNEKSTMPPPPVPPSTLPSESLITEAPSFSPSASVSQHTPRYSPGVSHADAESLREKCEFCHAIWTYPPPDTEGLPQKPSRTPQEMQQNMGAVSTKLADYQNKKDADFNQWRQLHSGGHCNCMDHSSGSKRKFEESVQNTSPPTKLQKRATESPPRTSHLTPPPDQANKEAASGRSGFDPKTDPRIPPTIARVLGHYIPPLDDSDNMFHDVHGEGKRVKREETAH
ncbi:hypothetical protein P171DRAFT_488744 [Karstenula rhodostoma CBS 690.94]|uniref:Uncharacterized protein n=1 Tax=Karstenula rhodostoma CBS 690.94 TaxID=1392251 RepID=A0A9P4PDQ9_9PLEO|nr:hypothetical protein P171DRAFT_488744 [Karstenula rhodostoma CBS 690.94]